MIRHVAFAVGAAGLALAPLESGAQLVAVPSCGGGAQLLVIPADPAVPPRGESCVKACHAATDRRVKTVNGAAGDPEDCC